MLFPDYDAECPVVSTAYVAAWYAHRVSQSIRAHESDIQSACRAIDPGCAIEFSSAYERLRHVRRKPLRSVWGQTDGATIELLPRPPCASPTSSGRSSTKRSMASRDTTMEPLLRGGGSSLHETTG